LGAAVVALAGIETHLRRQQGRSDPFTVQQAVATLVKYRETVFPNPAWLDTYRQVLPQFESAIQEAVES
jgi:xylulokinase